MLPLLMVMDVISMWRFRRNYSRELMPTLLAGAVMGTVLGYVAFRHLDEAWIRLLIGTIAVVFPLKDWLLRALGRGGTPTRPHKARGAFWASMAGLTSFIANAGSPPLMVYLLPMRLDKSVFVGTNVVFFTFVNLFKLGPFIGLGLMTAGNLATSLVLLPLAFAGIWLGLWLHERIPEKPFYFWCNVFLLLTGMKLLWDAAWLLLAR